MKVGKFRIRLSCASCHVRRIVDHEQDVDVAVGRIQRAGPAGGTGVDDWVQLARLAAAESDGRQQRAAEHEGAGRHGSPRGSGRMMACSASFCGESVGRTAHPRKIFPPTARPRLIERSHVHPLAAPLIPCALAGGQRAGGARPRASPSGLQTSGELPFTAEELEQAAGARLTMSAEAGAAVVIVGPGRRGGRSAPDGGAADGRPRRRARRAGRGAHRRARDRRARGRGARRRRGAATGPTPAAPGRRRGRAAAIAAPAIPRAASLPPVRRCGSRSRSAARRGWMPPSRSPGRARRT